MTLLTMNWMHWKIFSSFLFVCFTAAPIAYGSWSSQAGGRMEAAAHSLHATATAISDSSWICDLHCTLQQCQILNPSSKARDEFTPPSSWTLVRLLTCLATTETPRGHLFFRACCKCPFIYLFFFFCLCPWHAEVLGPEIKPAPRNSHCGTVEANPTRNPEVAILIPGLTQWVKDLVLPWAVVYVANTAWKQPCCGCGVGLQW